MRHLIVGTCALLFVVGCADDDLNTLPPPEAPPEAPPPVEPPPDLEVPLPPATSGTACLDNSECGADTECASGTCVGVGVLQVTLSFPMDADLDLHVFTPTGEEISYENPAAAGGVLDVDQCVYPCGEGTHVENIFFNGSLAPGNYIAWAVNYDGRSGGTFRIDVSGATTASLEGQLGATPEELTADLAFTVPEL